MGVPAYAPSVDYPIPPLGYISLDVHTLPIAIASGAHGASSIQRGQDRGVTSCNKSVNATYSHHHLGSIELGVLG